MLSSLFLSLLASATIVGDTSSKTVSLSLAVYELDRAALDSAGIDYHLIDDSRIEIRSATVDTLPAPDFARRMVSARIARVIASPRVTTLEDEPAVVELGDAYVTRADTIRLGLRIVAMARVPAENTILLDLKIRRTAGEMDNNGSVVVTNSAALRGSALVENGQTIAMVGPRNTALDTVTRRRALLWKASEKVAREYDLLVIAKPEVGPVR